jgi:hypothetical protein
MRHPHTIAVFAIILLAGLTSFAHAAQDFAIQLQRPVKVGDRYGLSANGSEEQVSKVQVNGQAVPPRSSALTVALTAKAEVLAVSLTGREMKTRFIITKATRTVESATGELMPAGTEIIAEHKGQRTEFIIDNMPASPDLAKALTVVISLEDDEAPGDDVIFGTKERKRVGDTWPVNSTEAAADFARRGGMKMDPKNMTGTTTLSEVTKIDGQSTLVISAVMTIKEVSIPLPQGIAVQHSEFKATFSGAFPVDGTKRAMRKSMTMEGDISCAGKAGDKDLSMAITMKRNKEVIFTKE